MSLKPLAFRISPDEAAEMVARHLGDRLPPEYWEAGVKVTVHATPAGMDVVFGDEAKKRSWKFWRTD